MTRRRLLSLRTGAATLLVALACSQAWAINRCTDKAGKVTYQEEKCPGDSSQKVVTPPQKSGPAQAPRATPKPRVPKGPGAQDKREDETILKLVPVQAGYEACVAATPDFEQRHGPVYGAWRKENAAALAKLERSARYRLLLERARQQQREQQEQEEGSRGKLATSCEEQFIPTLKGGLRQQPTR
jgi:hypothetical protein